MLVIQPRFVISHHQFIERGEKLEGQPYSAHELGANENLDGLQKAVAENPQEVRVYSQIYRQTEPPTPPLRVLGYAGMAAGALLSFFTLGAGLGVAAASAALVAKTHAKAASEPLSIRSMPSGHHQVTLDGGQVKLQRRSRAGEPQGRWRDFPEFLANNVKGHPGARHVCFISGHGGAGYSAGLDFDQLGESLDETRKQTGEGPELLVFKSCSVGQLENLTALAGKATAAVMSSTPIISFGFPTKELFSPANLAGSARQNAVNMADLLHDDDSNASHRAIDLEKLEQKTLPALDRLGESLQRDLLGGGRQKILGALHGSVIESPREGGEMLRFDLGKVLQNLEQAELGQEARKALAEVQESWPLLDQREGPGISFHMAPDGVASMQQKLPRWTTFIGSMRQALLE